MKNIQINVSSKSVKQLCSDTAQIMEATDQKGNKYYAKIISIEKSQTFGYAQCLQFNQEILEDVSQFPFKENFLDIKTRISNQECVGFITQPYQCTLPEFIVKQVINEKDMMNIFDQIVRSIYSLIMNGYWHRNVRAEHFVKCGKLWKLQSLVVSQDYSQANGLINQYLWSSKHEPPQFVAGRQYSDDQYNQMTVWNLGCILLHLIVSSHKLSNAEIINKFKGKPFTFEAIGIKSDRAAKLSYSIKDLLGSMLHYNPKERMKLSDLFQNKFISQAVSTHAIKNKQLIPPSKIVMGRSITHSKISFESRNVLNQISKTMNQKQKQKQKIYEASKLASIIDQQDFFDNLQELSTKIPNKNGVQLKKQKQQLWDIEQLMVNKNNHIRKSLQLYKSYFDQSELLVLAIENIDKLDFIMFKQESEIKEIKLLIKYSVLFVSLINLNTLAQGFNQNRNILDLDGDQFTNFQNSSEYASFQKFVNFKRIERTKELDAIRQEIQFFKKKNLLKIDNVFNFIQKDYKKTSFQDIKTAYRLIVKHAYDSISQQYNKNKKLQLAQRAMFVTYCLTIDKLYIKEHIPDNFKYYFDWINKPANNYVPLNDFKDFILNAPKEILIENSRYILKKYYNI